MAIIIGLGVILLAVVAATVSRRTKDERDAVRGGCRGALLASGVPEALLDRSANDSPLRFLFWRTPRLERVTELRNLIPALADLCPLAEENGEAVIGFLPSDNRFIRFYYEDAHQGEAAIEELGVGYQQFAATVLLWFEEAGLRDELEDAAVILGFRKTSTLRELLDAEPYDDEAVERFRESLAAVTAS